MSNAIAFLRGLNVGGHRVSMNTLRETLEAAGLAGVQTVIASGNVLFEIKRAKPRSLESKIEKALRSELGYEVDTFVRSHDDLVVIESSDVVAEASELGWNLHVAFLKEPATKTVATSFAGLQTPDDLFRVDGREVYWIRNGGISTSSVQQKHLNAALEKRTNTMRNFNTIRKILKKMG